MTEPVVITRVEHMAAQMMVQRAAKSGNPVRSAIVKMAKAKYRDESPDTAEVVVERSKRPV